jgi:hypothetical protein
MGRAFYLKFLPNGRLARYHVFRAGDTVLNGRLALFDLDDTERLAAVAT